MNSLSLCLSLNVLIYLSLMKDNFPGYKFLATIFFFNFSILNISSHCLLNCKVSADASSGCFIENLLYVMTHFLFDFQISHLVWDFWQFFILSFNMSLILLIFLGIHRTSFKFESSANFSSNNLSVPFSLLFLGIP